MKPLNTRREPVTDLIAECEANPRYCNVFIPDEAKALAECPGCECCGFKGVLNYRAFKGYGSHRAISQCPQCGDENDF